MPTLFDMRSFAQSSKRYLHLSDPRGHYLGTVGAIRAPALSGVWDDEAKEIVVADRAAMRSCVPHYWRKAFDRAQIWYRKGEPKGSITLYSARGQLLGTIYLTAKAV